jgi:hypothetical protein
MSEAAKLDTLASVSNCGVCGRPLIRGTESLACTCAIWGKEERALIHCPAGHCVCDELRRQGGLGGSAPGAVQNPVYGSVRDPGTGDEPPFSSHAWPRAPYHCSGCHRGRSSKCRILSRRRSSGKSHREELDRSPEAGVEPPVTAEQRLVPVSLGVSSPELRP